MLGDRGETGGSDTGPEKLKHPAPLINKGRCDVHTTRSIKMATCENRLFRMLPLSPLFDNLQDSSLPPTQHSPSSTARDGTNPSSLSHTTALMWHRHVARRINISRLRAPAPRHANSMCQLRRSLTRPTPGDQTARGMLRLSLWLPM